MKKKRKKRLVIFDAVMVFMVIILWVVDWDHAPIIFPATMLIILSILVIIRRLYDEFG